MAGIDGESIISPEDLAGRHPRLYHLTTLGAFNSIICHGLLSATALLDLFEIRGERREAIESRKRLRRVVLEHPVYGRAVINDNTSLTEAALTGCLEGDLKPADWLRMLNKRVFFWADEKGLGRLLGARANRGRSCEALEIDTLSLARTHGSRIEVSPINSGATFRRVAKRGLSTLTPLAIAPYEEWQRLRGHRDKVLEVIVRGGVPDIAQHLVSVSIREVPTIAGPSVKPLAIPSRQDELPRHSGALAARGGSPSAAHDPPRGETR